MGFLETRVTPWIKARDDSPFFGKAEMKFLVWLKFTRVFWGIAAF